MSVFSEIGDFAKRLIKNPAVQTIASVALPGVGGILAGTAGRVLSTAGAASQVLNAVQSLPAVQTTSSTLPLITSSNNFVTGGIFPSSAAGAVNAAARGMAPAGYHLAKDGSGRLVRNRRMNPCNPRALNRAVRRIKSFRRMAAKVERSLPKQKAPQRRAPKFIGRGSGTSIVNVD